MIDAIQKDRISVIGVGRPMCGDPYCVRKLLQDGSDLPRFEKMLGSPKSFFGVNSPIKLVKLAASFGVMAWYYDQIVLMADGMDNDPNPLWFTRFLALQNREMEWMKERKSWLAENRPRPGIVK
jgi:hypothetical protein